MAHHELVDVSVTVEAGTRQYVGRCRCGWESQPCGTSVHALALVEDHGRSSRVRPRRGANPSATIIPPAVAEPDSECNA